MIFREATYEGNLLCSYSDKTFNIYSAEFSQETWKYICIFCHFLKPRFRNISFSGAFQLFMTITYVELVSVNIMKGLRYSGQIRTADISQMTFSSTFSGIESPKYDKVYIEIWFMEVWVIINIGRGNGLVLSQGHNDIVVSTLTLTIFHWS